MPTSDERQTPLWRWIRRDPIGHADGLHLYAYTSNAPVNAADSFGLATFFTNVDVRKGSLQYSCYCGWIDWDHVAFGQEGASVILNNLTSYLGPEGRTQFGYSHEGTYGRDDFTFSYKFTFDRGTTSEAMIKTIALDVFMVLAHKFEASQSFGLLDGLIPSSFSQDDLPSFYLGALIGLGIISGKESLKDICGAVDIGKSQIIYEYMFKAGDNKRNYSHSPVKMSAVEAYAKSCGICKEDASKQRAAEDLFDQFGGSTGTGWE